MKEARAKVISRRLRVDVGKSLRNLTKSWLKPAGETTQDRIVESADPESQHTYSHVGNSGEMNHTGQYLCDHCGAEMRIVKYPLYPPSQPDVVGLKIPIGEEFRWQCSGCERNDETSFRVCTKCEKKTIPDKWAASARELPVSLNAGGCTDCEHCILCDGVLAIGNLRWFHGRWTHSYPSPEFDRRTGEQIMVTRERSKGYAFHAHHSCCERNPQAIPQIILQRTPEWYKQGEAEQNRLDATRLRREGRCIVCKNPLSFWDRVMERDRHRPCA